MVGQKWRGVEDAQLIMANFVTYAMTYVLFCHMVSKVGQVDHSEFFRVPWSAVDEHTTTLVRWCIVLRNSACTILIEFALYL